MISFCIKTAFLFVFVGTKVKKHLVLFIFNELRQLCALKFVCLCSIQDVSEIRVLILTSGRTRQIMELFSKTFI
jgi:hypothetical protein